MKKTVLFCLCVALSLFVLPDVIRAGERVTRMRTEYLEVPLGIDNPRPRFTWNIESDREFVQLRCRVSVATDSVLLAAGKPDFWTAEPADGGRMCVRYDGKRPLAPHTRYWWRVEVWDRRGRKAVSVPGWFETAKMKPADWSGVWIGDWFDKEYRKAPMLRRGFSVGKPVRSARAYVCGVGYYEMFINGRRVGDRLLDPGYTHFDKRVLYSTYDVTELLKEGENAVAAVLGNGWLNIQSLAVWNFHKARWRMRPRLLCDLRIEYADGSVETIASDTSWRYNTGPYVYNNLYSGDMYDARLEKTGWTEPGYDDSGWDRVRQVEAPAPLVTAQQMPPIRITKEIVPADMKSFPDNVYVFDMGKNISGLCRLKIRGQAGTCVKIRHGELLHPDGRLNQGNIDVYFQREGNDRSWHRDPNEVFQTDTYYLKGGGTEVWMPSFCYHGFRYVEVESDRPVEIGRESVTGLFIHTDVEPVGSFRCSDTILNRIHEATCHTYLSNLHSIPTDCPQREKNGWTADAYISLDLGLLNYDGIAVYEKWMNDFVDNQREAGDISGIVPSAGWGYEGWIGPVWDAAMFVIPYKLNMYYGDTRAIEALYPTLRRYLEYLKTREKDGILTYGLGDWVYYKAKTDASFTSTVFYWLDNALMARFSEQLGHDPAPYRRKAEELRRTIVERWYDPATGLWANGTQAAQAVALGMGMVPAGEEQRTADRLAEMIRRNGYHLDFGMLGSKLVPSVLARYGYAEDAYRMIVNPEAPSWANWIYMGLTTLPETWVMDKGFKDASLNHSFLGDVTAWMTQVVAGINYDRSEPGFRHVIFTPRFIKALTWAEGEYRSVSGTIRSRWERKNGRIRLTLTVPANVRGTLRLDRDIRLRQGENVITVEDR